MAAYCIAACMHTWPGCISIQAVPQTIRAGRKAGEDRRAHMLGDISGVLIPHRIDHAVLHAFGRASAGKTITQRPSVYHDRCHSAHGVEIRSERVRMSSTTESEMRMYQLGRQTDRATFETVVRSSGMIPPQTPDHTSRVDRLFQQFRSKHHFSEHAISSSRASLPSRQSLHSSFFLACWRQKDDQDSHSTQHGKLRHVLHESSSRDFFPAFHSSPHRNTGQSLGTKGE